MNTLCIQSFTSHPAYALLGLWWLAKVDQSGKILELHGDNCPFLTSVGQHVDDVFQGVDWQNFIRSAGWRTQVKIGDQIYHMTGRRLPFHPEFLVSIAPPQEISHDFTGLSILAGHFAHELRTPLHVLRERVGLTVPPEAREKLIALCDHILSIVKGLQNLSRGLRDDIFTSLDLRQAVDEALQLTQNRLNSLGVEVTIEQISPAPMKGNLAQLIQVFLNLVTNAADAMENSAQKQLLITIGVKDEHIICHLHDSGSGISAELRHNLMRPFHTTKGSKGTGLGLHISQQIILKHGGQLNLRPSPQGTCFEISLPESQAL